MTRLNVTRGERAGTVYELTDRETLVGTSRKAQVRLLDPGIAFKHATILAEGTAFTLQDARSATGTYVNGARLKRSQSRQLEDGDLIRFGEVEARFEAAEAPAKDSNAERDALVLRVRDLEDELIRLRAGAPEVSDLQLEVEQLRAEAEVIRQRLAESRDALQALEARCEAEVARRDVVYRQRYENEEPGDREFVLCAVERSDLALEVEALRAERHALRESTANREDQLLAERKEIARELAEAKADLEAARADLEAQGQELRELEAEAEALRQMRDAVAAGAEPA